MTPCLVCDLERAVLTPIEAFVLGIGIRRILDENVGIAEQMCGTHRAPTVMAMVSLATKMVAVEEK